MASNDETTSQSFLEIEEHFKVLKDCVSDFVDIACLPSTIKEAAEIQLRGCRIMAESINICENKINNIKNNAKGKEKMEIESPLGEKQILKDEEMKDFKTSEKEISLRPQTGKTILQEKLIRIDLPIQNSYVETYVSIMMNLYKLSNNESRYIDFSGLYPRLNFLQGSSPDEIRYWYDFGAVNAIFLTSPDFGEISLLPEWIKIGVKDIYL